MGKYVLAYDVGTTGIKTCLIEIDDSIRILSSASQGYNLYVLENGGAEQDPQEWWDAMIATTRRIFAESSITPQQIEGISFCSQAQGLVLVDRDGVPRAQSVQLYGPARHEANQGRLEVRLAGGRGKRGQIAHLRCDNRRRAVERQRPAVEIFVAQTKRARKLRESL